MTPDDFLVGELVRVDGQLAEVMDVTIHDIVIGFTDPDGGGGTWCSEILDSAAIRRRVRRRS